MAKLGRPKKVPDDFEDIYGRYQGKQTPQSVFDKERLKIATDRLIKAYTDIAELAGVEFRWSEQNHIKQYIKDHIV